MTKVSASAKVLMFVVLFNYAAKSQIGYQTVVTTGLTDPIDIAIQLDRGVHAHAPHRNITCVMMPPVKHDGRHRIGQ